MTRQLVLERSRDKALKVFKPKPRLPKQARLLNQLNTMYPELVPSKYYFSNYPGIIGMEIEVEKLYTKDFMHPLWKSIGDGSLKDDGRELLSIPMQGRVIDHALSALDWIFKRSKPVYYFNHRCSTHLHINVSNLSIEELCEFYGLYTLLEPWFFAFAEPHRYHNGYCIPVAEVCMSRHEFLHGMHKEQTKYLAMASNHLNDFGTLELRILHGTNDPVVLRRWIMMLQKTLLFTLKNDVSDIVVGNHGGSTSIAKEVFNTILPHIPAPQPDRVERSAEAAYYFLCE